MLLGIFMMAREVLLFPHAEDECRFKVADPYLQVFTAQTIDFKRTERSRHPEALRGRQRTADPVLQKLEA